MELYPKLLFSTTNQKLNAQRIEKITNYDILHFT